MLSKTSMRFLSALLMLLAARSVGAQTITSVSNAASYMPPGLTSSGVAQGSMFVIKGTGLGPSAFAVATTFPLPAAIGGASVRVTAGGTSVDCIMYYAGATQIAAILPSSTPAGAATLVVTVNGRTSAAFGFQVVRNALGIFTIPQSGAGEAIATAGNSFVSPLNAVNPGDIVGFWGTGLGPVTGNEANAAVQADLASIPIEAYVGGKQAEVLFRGRNGCCSSVDTVYVRIPVGASGCATPVMFKIGEARSNTATVAIAESGRTCTPTGPTLDANRLSTLLSKPAVGIGVIRLLRQRSVNTPRGLSGRSDGGSALFHRVTVPAGGLGLGPAIDIPPPGSCLISAYPTISTGPAPLFASTTMNAGASLTLNGPPGQRTFPGRVTQGVLSYTVGFGVSEFFTDGPYTVAGTGAPEGTANSVGAFTASVNLPPPLVWTNQKTIVTVNRSQGVTVNWTGGDPYGFVIVRAGTGSSDNLDASAEVDISCTARASDGTFSIPSSVLLALPATPSMGAGLLSVEGVSFGAVPAPGLDFGSLTAVDWSGAVVDFR